MKKIIFNPIEGIFDYVDVVPTEVIPFTISSNNVWLRVPTTLIKIFNVEIFDQFNQQKITIDFRINVDNTLDVRSNKNITITVRIQGE